jgi:hypothetical protein
MLDKMIHGMNFDVGAISTETLHQVGSTLDVSRPSREVVEDLIDDVVCDAIKEVVAVNESPQRVSNQIEVGAEDSMARTPPVQSPRYAIGDLGKNYDIV